MKAHEFITADGITLHYDEYGTGDRTILPAPAKSSVIIPYIGSCTYPMIP